MYDTTGFKLADIKYKKKALVAQIVKRFAISCGALVLNA
jgi:hypothetical protein